MSGTARLVFLGRLADLAGVAERDWPLAAETSVAALCAAQPPALAGALADPRIRFAINGALASGEAVVKQGDELAFLPAVSGG